MQKVVEYLRKQKNDDDESINVKVRRKFSLEFSVM